MTSRSYLQPALYSDTWKPVNPVNPCSAAAFTEVCVHGTASPGVGKLVTAVGTILRSLGYDFVVSEQLWQKMNHYQPLCSSPWETEK